MKPRLSEDPTFKGDAWSPRWVGEIPWRYSVSEIRVDAAVHALSFTLACLALLGFVLVPPMRSGETVAVAVYLLTLITSIVLSAVYNLWPVSRPKWILRRLDHSAVYLLIAGTYTPFMVRLEIWWLLAAVWMVASAGIALKLLQAGRGDTLSIALYLALGWSGIIVCESLAKTLPPASLWLIGAGGLVYSAGVVFHVWERLPFQNAVWHGFVLVGGVLHYGAVWSAVSPET